MRHMYNFNQYRIDVCSLIHLSQYKNDPVDYLHIPCFFPLFYSPCFLSHLFLSLLFSFPLLPCFLSCLFHHFLLHCLRCIVCSHFPFFLFFPFAFFPLSSLYPWFAPHFLVLYLHTANLQWDFLLSIPLFPYLFPPMFSFYFSLLAYFLHSFFVKKLR